MQVTDDVLHRPGVLWLLGVLSALLLRKDKKEISTKPTRENKIEVQRTRQ